MQLIDEQKQTIETLVDRILTAKQSDPAAGVRPLETQIDHLVYHLYNLTPEEIAIEEGSKVAVLQCGSGKGLPTPDVGC